jgi:glycerophosphoryl diester phosphodiesterase
MNPPAIAAKPVSRPEIHGHRGCRGLRPENTLPAFLHALTLGVDVLEMDVVIAADGEVIVSHEPWLTPLCRDAAGRQIQAGTERDHNLYRLTTPEIRRCDCGQTPHPGFPDQLLLPAFKPTLRETIQAVEAMVGELARPAVGYSIELKSEPAGDGIFHPAPTSFVALVLAVLRATPAVLARTTILSFDKRILQAVRQQAPTLPVCLLVEDELPLAEHLAELDFLPDTYGPKFQLVTAPMVAHLRALGIHLVPWTVNEPGDMRRLLSLGVSGLTTDYPDRLHALLF